MREGKIEKRASFFSTFSVVFLLPGVCCETRGACTVRLSLSGLDGKEQMEQIDKKKKKRKGEREREE